MKVHLTEIEVELSEIEKETLRMVFESFNGQEMPIDCKHQFLQPHEIRNWLNKCNMALQTIEKCNEDFGSERIKILELRRNLKSIVKGISEANNRFDEAY